MWFAPPTLRQMLWMLWDGFKKGLSQPSACDICGAANPTEPYRELKLCSRCRNGVREMVKKA